MIDQAWTGPDAAMTAALAALGYPIAQGTTPDPRVLALVGPRSLDGTSYVLIRSTVALTLPTGLAVTGPQLSAAVVGTIA